MDVKGEVGYCDAQSEEEMELKRGPWTVEEDFALVDYIARHGEGRWSSLSRCAGLKRTGKSCRLRWLNYLRPDVRRGNITLEEQLLILELHSRWGNRWSKIAQHLPGRTDNEIKNYWRTRVQKHAKQLKCDVNSKQFKDTMRYLWMPRLVERIQAAAAATGASSATTTPTTTNTNNYNLNNNYMNMNIGNSSQVIMPRPNNNGGNFGGINVINPSVTPENSSTAASSDSGWKSQVSPVSDLTDCFNYPVNHNHNQDYFQSQVSPVSDLTDCFNYPVNHNHHQDYFQANQLSFAESLISPSGYFNNGLDFQSVEPNNPWLVGSGDLSDNLWNVEDIWFLQQQFSNNI